MQFITAIIIIIPILQLDAWQVEGKTICRRCHRDVWPVTSPLSAATHRLRRKTGLSPPDQWLFSGTLSPHETLRTSLNLFWASHSTLMSSQRTGFLPVPACRQSHRVPQRILPACQGPRFRRLAQTTGRSDLDALPGHPPTVWVAGCLL